MRLARTYSVAGLPPVRAGTARLPISPDNGPPMSGHPLARPADSTVAKLVWSRDGQPTVQSVGGSLPLSSSRQGPAHPAARREASTSVTPVARHSDELKVTGKQLDPAGTDDPVYRFDVPATTWPLPVSTPPRIQTVLPPVEVHGVMAGGDDVSLGLLVPQGQPSRATSGSVTLSPVSFYWQNPAIGQQITDVYVQVGSSRSNSVNLAGLPAPAAGRRSASSWCVRLRGLLRATAADPFANGLDQATLRIQVPDLDQALSARPGVQADLLPRRQRRPAHRPDPRGWVRVHPGQPVRRGLPQRRLDRHPGASPGQWPGRWTVRLPVHHLHRRTRGHRPRRRVHRGQRSDRRRGSSFNPQVQLEPRPAQGSTSRAARDNTGTDVCRTRQGHRHHTGTVPHHRPRHQELLIGLQFATTAQTSLTSLPYNRSPANPNTPSPPTN